MLRALPHCSISSPNLPLLLHSKRNCRAVLRPTSAKKTDNGDDAQTREDNSFPLKISRAIVAKSAIAIFALGFLDAGYSGDWSRIGVISKETEDVLKIAAYLVMPLCFLLAFLVSDEEKAM